MFTVSLVWEILVPYWATKSETFPRKFHTSQPYTHMIWILVKYEPLWHKNLLGTRKEYDQFLQCLQAWHTSDQIPLRLISDVDKQCIEHGDLLTWKIDRGTGFWGPNFRKIFSFCVSEKYTNKCCIQTSTHKEDWFGRRICQSILFRWDFPFAWRVWPYIFTIWMAMAHTASRPMLYSALVDSLGSNQFEQKMFKSCIDWSKLKS